MDTQRLSGIQADDLEANRISIQEIATIQNTETKSNDYCTSYRFNIFATFIYVAVILATLFNPEIHGISKPPCPRNKGLLNGKCVTYCSIQNFVDGLTGGTFEQALSKCLYSCPDGVVMNGRCVKTNMNEFFDDAAK